MYWASCVNSDGVRHFELRATEDRDIAYRLGAEYRIEKLKEGLQIKNHFVFSEDIAVRIRRLFQ
jgi:hypothetical protein